MGHAYDEKEPEKEKKKSLKERMKEKAREKLAKIEANRLESLDMPKLDYNEKNFPPCVKCINFDPTALEGRIKKFSQKLWWGTLS